jgi:ankyrin repeat protein
MKLLFKLSKLTMLVGLFVLPTTGFADGGCDNANADGKKLFQLVSNPATSVKDLEGFFQSHTVPVDATDSKCRTAFNLAVERVDFIRFLFDQYGHPDVTVPGANGWSIHGYAYRYGSFETISFLKKYRPLPVPKELIAAASSNTVATIEKLIQSGSKLYETDENGMTAFFYAVMRNTLPVITYLLPFFDINATDQLGQTPLMVVAQNEKKVPVVELLVSKGANLRSCRPGNWEGIIRNSFSSPQFI